MTSRQKFTLVLSVLITLIFGWSGASLVVNTAKLAFGHSASYLPEISLSSVNFAFNKSDDWAGPDWTLILPYIHQIIDSGGRQTYAEPVKLYFVGDIMLDRGVRRSVNNHGGGDYNFLFQNLAWLNQADIVFGNLEGPASDQGRDLGGLYSFRMSPEVIPALFKAGFNVLSVANNHAGDWGHEAFVDTLSRLDQAGIRHPGGGLTRNQAESPSILEKGSVRYGFLAFTDVGPAWLAVQDEVPGILLASDRRFETIISEASSKVDVLIVSLHFGEEYEPLPNARQQALARGAIDAGAKIVAGHHPHVIQPVEKYNGGLIAYSLGNFIFDQYFSAETMEGLVLEVDMRGGEIINWQTKIVKLDSRFVPSLSESE